MYIIKLDRTDYFRGLHNGKVVSCEYEIDAKAFETREEADAMRSVIRKASWSGRIIQVISK